MLTPISTQNFQSSSSLGTIKKDRSAIPEMQVVDGVCTNAQEVVDAMAKGNDTALLKFLDDAITQGHVGVLNTLIKTQSSSFDMSLAAKEKLLAKNIAAEKNESGVLQFKQLSQPKQGPESPKEHHPFNVRDLPLELLQNMSPFLKISAKNLFHPSNKSFVDNHLNSSATREIEDTRKNIVIQAVKQDQGDVLREILTRPDTKDNLNLKALVIKEAFLQSKKPFLRAMLSSDPSLYHAGVVGLVCDAALSNAQNTATLIEIINEAINRQSPEDIQMKKNIINLPADENNQTVKQILFQRALYEGDHQLLSNILKRKIDVPVQGIVGHVFKAAAALGRMGNLQSIMKDCGFNLFGKGLNLSKCDLRMVDAAHFFAISEADISGTDLSNRRDLNVGRKENGYKLEKTYFQNRNLTETNFRGANLEDHHFSHSRLNDADMRDANLTNVKISTAASVQGLKINQKAFDTLPFREKMFSRWHIYFTGQVKFQK